MSWRLALRSWIHSSAHRNSDIVNNCTRENWTEILQHNRLDAKSSVSVKVQKQTKNCTSILRGHRKIGTTVFFRDGRQVEARELFTPEASWLGGLVVSARGMRTPRPRFESRVAPCTIPQGSHLGQVVYSHCLPSFSAPRNWGTKGSFRRLSGYGD